MMPKKVGEKKIVLVCLDMASLLNQLGQQRTFLKMVPKWTIFFLWRFVQGKVYGT